MPLRGPDEMEPCRFMMHPHDGFFPLLVSFPQTSFKTKSLASQEALRLWANHDVGHPMSPFKIFSPKSLSWAMRLEDS